MATFLAALTAVAQQGGPSPAARTMTASPETVKVLKQAEAMKATPAKAAPTYRQAGTMARASGDHGTAAAAFHQAAAAHLEVKQVQPALDALEDARTEERASGNKEAELGTLQTVARVSKESGDGTRASRALIQSVPLATTLRPKAEVARTWTQVMTLQVNQRPAAAVFAGKQALAVLAKNAATAKTPRERYQASAAAVPIYTKVSAVLLQATAASKATLPPQGVLEVQALLARKKQMEDAAWRGATDLGSDDLSPPLTDEEKAIADATEISPDQVLEIPGGADLHSRRVLLDVSGGLPFALDKLGAGTVAVLTLVDTDNLFLVLVTSEGSHVFQVAVRKADVARRVEAFRSVIQARRPDVTPEAQALYNVLVRPLEGQLQGVQTILWSLDGPLRYVPMAALWDGKDWLAKRFAQANFVLANLTRLSEAMAKRPWSAVSFGVSKGFDPLPPLPGVADELSRISQIPKSSKVSWNRYLDQGFTLAKFQETIDDKPRRVVHIASHFVFSPTRTPDQDCGAAGSFLLLGDGSRLTLCDFGKLPPQAVRKVELFTLSACQTELAAERMTDPLAGAEIEGLSGIVMRQGAAALITSLWVVADDSTPRLFEGFYGHFLKKREPKIKALAVAQRDMIDGQIAPQSCAIQPAADGRPSQGCWTHPFYWAPFVLTGNPL